MIPVSCPKKNYLAHKEEIDDAVAHVMASGQYVGGEEVERFEEEWAAYVGTKYAIGVGSGTEAITMVLRALGIGPGDEVIVPSFTCTATVAPIALVGATPVFVDVDKQTRTVSVTNVEPYITPKTKAILPVHLYGSLAPVLGLQDLADFHGIWLIEDACQAHGARYQNSINRAGSFGIAGCHSFYPTKNLNCFGDGGAITTSNTSLAKRLKSIRQYAWDEQRSASSVAGQSRLDPIQAAVLRVKLKYLDTENDRRIDIATHYYNEFVRLEEVTTPLFGRRDHVFHQYVVGFNGHCASIRSKLRQFGVESAVHYPVPVHKQPAYASIIHLKHTQALSGSILSLPVYPELTDAEVEHVASSFVEAMSGFGRP